MLLQSRQITVDYSYRESVRLPLALGPDAWNAHYLQALGQSCPRSLQERRKIQP
jgi:hypothetical protein